MDDDNGDEGNHELICVKSDESDKSSWSAGRRSFSGRLFQRDRVMHDCKSGCWLLKRKRKMDERGLITTSEKKCCDVIGRNKIIWRFRGVEDFVYERCLLLHINVDNILNNADEDFLYDNNPLGQRALLVYLQWLICCCLFQYNSSILLRQFCFPSFCFQMR